MFNVFLLQFISEAGIIIAIACSNAKSSISLAARKGKNEIQVKNKYAKFI